MAKIPQLIFLFSLMAFVACCGCSRWKKIASDDQKYRQENRVLAPVGQSVDNAVLEVFFVTFPPDANAALDAVWKEANEQKQSSDQQRQLANQGFRVGTAANPAPAALEQLLRSKTSGADGTIQSLDTDPTVSRKVLSLRFDNAGQILATEIEPRVPLLQLKNNQLRGRDYLRAQGLFSILTTTADAGRVSIELTPEMHHGAANQRWTGRDGRFVMEASRPKEAFAQLTTRSSLAPGDMLLVGGRADRPGSLGHFFFSRQIDGQTQQRLLVIRVRASGE
jgi:hypothetical protein